MTTLAAVLTDRLKGLSIELSPVRLDSLLIDAGLGDGSAEYDSSNSAGAKKALLSVLTDLLAMPDVTEGGLSLKWDRSAVQRYVVLLTAELGLTSAVSAPLIVNRSDLW